jgi:hypothetical protein
VTANPEDDVLDAIDQLDICELCGGDWHGTPIGDFDPRICHDGMRRRKPFCPGAFATARQRDAWRLMEESEPKRPLIGIGET